jgi:3-hydroxyacyl-CoA dehydrogenase
MGFSEQGHVHSFMKLVREIGQLTGAAKFIGSAAEHGMISDDEIVLRCIFALVNEAAAVLADGIASSSADIDTVLVNGYGFPKSRGGAWFFAENHDWHRVVNSMERWKATTGDDFWQPHPLIAAKVEGAQQ